MCASPSTRTPRNCRTSVAMAFRGMRKWLEWCDEEYVQLQAALRAMREEQAPLLKQRAQMWHGLSSP